MSFKPQALAKKAIFAAADYQYHQSHKRQALEILRHIENAKGKTNPALLRKSDAYARDVLGWLGYAPWLYVYVAVTGVFKEGWLPDNYYGKVVVPAMKGRYGAVSDLKPLSRMVFRSDVFPDIAYFVNGLFYSTSFRPVQKEEVKALLFSEADRVVFKADDSLQGKGISFFERSSFDLVKLRSLPNGVFQKYIDQHQLFDEFMHSSVATLRITTTIDDNGSCTVRAAYLRLGRATDTHIKSASHVRVPIDPKSGQFAKNGFLTSWLSIDRHPDSERKFAGNGIPAFSKCLSTVLELHKRMPYDRCIGWDVSIDKNNDVRILEWNGSHNDVKFSEATQGPCFTDLKWDRLWRPRNG